MTVRLKKTGYLLNKQCAHITSGDIKQIAPQVYGILIHFVDDRGKGVPIQVAPSEIGWAKLFGWRNIMDQGIV